MSQIVKMNAPVPAQGNWVWDGANWVCDTDCPPSPSPPPCPPFGTAPFPPFGPPVFSGPTQQPPWYPGANGGVSFGATFPANPVRGHLFWDGKTFWLFDGASWVTISAAPGSPSGGSGAATGTTPPSSPFNGQLWFDGTTLKIWNGMAWVASAVSGPILGVTDGSNVPTGNVGEWIMLSATQPVPATSSTTSA